MTCTAQGFCDGECSTLSSAKVATLEVNSQIFRILAVVNIFFIVMLILGLLVIYILRCNESNRQALSTSQEKI